MKPVNRLFGVLLAAALLVPAFSAAEVQAADTPPQGMEKNMNALISVPSSLDVPAARAKVEAFLKEKNIHLFAVIDHAANAESAGLRQLPATVLVFGNPAAGTPLMQAAPLMALELPLKMLISKDGQGKTWLTYHNLEVIAPLYGLDAGHPALKRMNGLLADIAGSAR